MLFGWFMALAENIWLMALHLSGRSSFPKPLSMQEEQALVRRMLEGDKAAREKLIVHNLRLAAHIAKKYSASGVDGDDLVSIGAIGLMKAVNTFRPDAGRLTAYAARCIENEILMHLRADKKNKGTVSLNDPIGTDSEGNEVRLIDLLGSDADEVPAQVEISIEAGRAAEMLQRALDDRERQVILLRYGLLDGEMHPQHEVARLLGISRSYVSRIEKHALKKLRQAMDGG